MLTDSEKEQSKSRCERIAGYIIEHKTTVRGAALHFGISKSTVHKDVTERLSRSNPSLYKKVNAVLQQNKEERHIRGGEATRKKYMKKQGS
mgnify:CR=1 FL=1|jgi:putative DeoR family transcriptional regulator (stage III sporulation protein D)